MSINDRFLKHLMGEEAPPGPPVPPVESADAPKCPACGYLLIGLGRAGMCPECGAAYQPNSAVDEQRDGAVVERAYVYSRTGTILVPSHVIERRRWQTAATAMGMAALGVLALQVSVLVVVVLPLHYFLAMGVLSLVWALGFPVLLPPAVRCTTLQLGRLRVLAWTGQWCWPVSFGLTALVLTGTLNATLVTGMNITASVLAVLGSVASVAALLFVAAVARDLEMRPSARLLQFAAYFFPIWAILVWVLPYPAYVIAIPVGPVGFIVTFIYLVLLAPWWAIYLVTFRSLMQLANRGRWSSWDRKNVAMRPARIAAKRAAMNKSIGVDVVGPNAEAPVKSTEHWDGSGDIPLSRPPTDAPSAD